ncbi:MAG: glycoside hydrolase family 2 protein [Anaerolineae bacterium]|nr:glycoside hydrolase family 2 protein [Anaerolineae bacterium]
MFNAWKLADFAPGQGVAAGANTESFDHANWIDVSVPGDVHRALIAAGRIPDPYYDQNETQCAWVEDREWWYRRRFDLAMDAPHSDERLQLVFHGLDTFATLWLNGEQLGTTQNMFRSHVFDVTTKLRVNGSNVLAICFDRPLDHADPERVKQFSAWGNDPERVLMRKAQFGYGWDWGPRLPTVGIWMPVELKRQRQAALTGTHFYTVKHDAAQNLALVAVHVEADPFATEQPLAATIRLVPDPAAAADGSIIEHTLSLKRSGDQAVGTAYLQVNNPHLWWTHDLGNPTLYTLQIDLQAGDAILDSHESMVGIRTLTLDQSPDPAERGTRFFRFVLNGVPIFARGADWIPAESFVGGIPDSRYQLLLTAARDANMNMLRIWGGGIYEHDVFYNLCDQLGLLIWQDFMFACAMYPEDDPVFVKEVELEAIAQVRRLRSHPSLALWNGNNENQWIHDQVFWDRVDYPVPGALYYHHILPSIVSEHDGQIPYWPGSPFGGSDHASMEDGNRHNWQVWHGNVPRRFGEEPQRVNTPDGVSFALYAKDSGRFISEFGMHAAPVYETLRRNIPADQLYHHSPSMDHHNKDNPKNKGDNLMIAVTGLPATLEDYIDYSMIAQAEGLKFGIEHFRRRKPHCSGTLFWQLNDCWPVLSWSVMDYYGFGKAGYYYAKRVYASLLASFKLHDDGSVELWLTNDTLQAVTTTVTVALRAFTGATVWADTTPVTIAANDSQPVLRWDADCFTDRTAHYLSVASSDDAFPRNRAFFGMIKDVERVPVAPTVQIAQISPHELRATLTAPAFAYFVHFTVASETVQFSDNYFDLEPDETKVVTITDAQHPLRPTDISLAYR